ncbi:MAG: Na+/H+ antiporter NhaA [Actinomycetota bacterium]
MSLEQPPPRGTWVASDRPVPRLVVRPLREFLDTEVAGGVVLLAAAVIALVWANSPWQDAYENLWSTEFVVRLGAFEIADDLTHWVNDALMVIFFFVVGLEIKRELVDGELTEPRRAALPVVAALGGMVVPALLYYVLNAGGAGARGWGIPMATDIAFALGVLALVGPRVPSSLKVFLLSLAIVDDIGAILVIAVFYSGGIQIGWLGAALGLLALVVLLRVIHVWWVPVYVVVGTAVWLATFESGVHATIAGVVLGLLTPATPLDPSALDSTGLGTFDGGERPSPHEVRVAQTQANASLSVAERFSHLLHPWTSFVIVPLFALANAGISLGADDLGAALRSPVTLGVIVGLVAGKVVGITGFAWSSVRLGVARLPEDIGWAQLGGAAALAGIGFTVSIFIAGLAFEEVTLVEEAKVGILIASVVASLIGSLTLRGRRVRAAPRARPRQASRAGIMDE